MKNVFLAGAAFAVCALPTFAQAADLPLKAAPAYMPQATGYIEVYGGWASTRLEATATGVEEGSGSVSETIKGGVLGGAGRGTYWVGPNMSIQLDVQAEGTSYDNPSIVSLSSSSNFSALDYLIGGHVSWRDPGRYLWGAFAGIGDVSEAAARHGVFGGEGQYYMGPFTFYGQLGYDTTLHRTCAGICFEEGSDVNAWFVRATGRYYYTPNIRFEGTILYADGEMNSPSLGSETLTQTFNTLLWEAKAEWKMDHNPFAFFFKYRGSESDYAISCGFCGPGSSGESVSIKVTDNRFLVGARMYLGEGTLLFNDRQGTTLDIIAPLAIQSGPLYGGGINSIPLGSPI